MRHIVSPICSHVLPLVLSFAAVFAVQPVFAAAPIVASGSVSLSNVQLTVNDFRPDDGLAAGVSWVSPGYGWLEASCCDGSDYFEHNEFRQLDIYGDTLTNPVSSGVSLVGGVASAYRTVDGAQVALSIDADHIGSIYSGGKYDPGSRAPRRFVWKPTATIGGGRSAVWACGQVAERLVHMPMRPCSA